jgi:hypothetical protein
MRVKAAKGVFLPFYGRPTIAYRHPAVNSPPCTALMRFERLLRF